MSHASDQLSRLKEKKLPRLTADDILTSSKPRAEWTEAELADFKLVGEYCKDFLPVTGNCVCCDAKLGGLFGAFTWGIAHGEGYCSQCGYPARAFHKIEGFGSFHNVILQYHPDDLEPHGT